MADHADSDSDTSASITHIEETQLQQGPSASLSRDSSQKGPKQSSSTVSSSSSSSSSLREKQQEHTSSTSCKNVFTECKSSVGEKQELGLSENQEMLNSVSGEKASLCDLVSGSGICERITQEFARKIQNFGVQMQEKENSAVGFASDGEKNQDDFEWIVIGIKEQKEKGEDCVKSEEGFSGVARTDNQSVSGNCKSKRVAMQSVSHENREFFMVKKMEAESSKKHGVGSFFKGRQRASSVDSNTNTEIFGAFKGVDEAVGHSLKIQVIDDTALVEPMLVPITGNGGVKGTKKNEKHGTDGKKAKHPWRKEKDMKQVHGKSGRPKKMWRSKGGLKSGDQMKRKYSKEEMEALRFANIVEQQKMWRDIYNHLGDVVVKEYNDLVSSKHQKSSSGLPNSKHQNRSLDPRQCFGRKQNGPSILGVDAARGRWNHSNCFYIPGWSDANCQIPYAIYSMHIS